jgi:hypothetical protein
LNSWIYLSVEKYYSQFWPTFAEIKSQSTAEKKKMFLLRTSDSAKNHMKKTALTEEVQACSTFERLITLSNLKDGRNGKYGQRRLAEMPGDDKVDRLLREDHWVAFQAWLCLPLEQQNAGVSRYLQNHGVKDKASLRHWMRTTPVERLVPSGVSDGERDQFVTDLETVLLGLYLRGGVVTS